LPHASLWPAPTPLPAWLRRGGTLPAL